MTQAQRRATERAYAQGIRVVNDYGEGGDRTLTVTSSAGIFGPDYTVTRSEHGTLACTCQAGQHGLVCKRRAAVHEYLVREHERELARERARARPRSVVRAVAPERAAGGPHVSIYRVRQVRAIRLSPHPRIHTF